jgi:hypothetical protein
MCSGPVGLGAKRTLTFELLIVVFLKSGAKIKEKDSSGNWDCSLIGKWQNCNRQKNRISIAFSQF